MSSETVKYKIIEFLHEYFNYKNEDDQDLPTYIEELFTYQSGRMYIKE